MEENIKKIRLKNIMSDSELKTFYYSKNLTELYKIRQESFKKLGINTKEMKRTNDKELIEYNKVLIENSDILKKFF